MMISFRSIFAVHDTSLLPYLLLMSLFVLEAVLLQRFIPFFRNDVLQNQANKNHSPQVDGLRGLLALGVFFTHAETFRQLWKVGKWDLPASRFYSQLAIAPVAMFFLLTGYLFWTKALNTKQQSWSVFFQQRVRRLLPAYGFALLLIALVVAFESQFQRNVSMGAILKSCVAYLTFNLIPAGNLNGLPNSTQIYANVFWSLRVEWMFYLAFPVLALFARGRRAQILLLVSAVLLNGLLPALRQHIHMGGGAATGGLGTLQYFNFYLVSYFGVGMFAAYLKKNYSLQTLVECPACIVGIGVVAAVLFLVPPTAGPLEGCLLGIPFLMVIAGNSFFGLLKLRPLVMLGQISYSTYLLHGIVLYTGSRLLQQRVDLASMSPAAFWAFTAAMGMVAVLLSAFSYRFFEAPFLRHNVATRKTIVPTVTSIPVTSGSVLGGAMLAEG